MNLTTRDLALPKLDLGPVPDRMVCPLETKIDCPTVTLAAGAASISDLADHQAELRRLMN